MYDHHIARAARYAALALTDRAPTPDEIDQVRALHDDVAVNLAQTIRRITGISPALPTAVQVIEVARHPVRALLNRLTSLPRLGSPVEDLPAPSHRWSGRAAGLSTADNPVAVWKGLAVEAFLADDALDRLGPRLTDDLRWSAVGDIATLAEALAHTNSDLLPQVKLNDRDNRRARAAFAGLAVEAREASHLAGTPERMPGASGARGPGRIVTLPSLDALPAATRNLSGIVGAGEPSVIDLLTITRMLAQVSRAASSTLAAAATAPDVGLAPMLVATSEVLAAHGGALAETVTSFQTRLGTLAPGSQRALAQARELGAIAVPRLRDLALRPTRAEAASPALLEYAAVVADTTRVIRDEFTSLHERAEIFVRDRTVSTAHGWRPTRADDLAAVLTGINRALDAALAAPAPPRAHAAPNRTAVGVPVLDLRAAMARRQVELRPAEPTGAAINGHFPAIRDRRVDR